jgi:cytochrome c oxidase subunit 3
MIPGALAEHYEDREKQDHAARLAMWLFLGSEVMFFAALFALYGAFRVTYPADFRAAAHHQALALGSLNTVILITSSFTVALGIHFLRVGRGKVTAGLLATSGLMGCAFLVIKATEYAGHFREGIVPGPRYDFAALPGHGVHVYFNLYFAMTGLHALHVIAGIVVLAWLATRAARAPDGSGGTELAVELGGLYWHLVDLVWLFLWPLFYLLH